MEVAAFVLSIVSLIISSCLAYLEIVSGKKINDINLEAELSKEIIKNYLTEIFPAAISEIYFKKKRLTNIVPLQNALNELRKNLRFFKYCDSSFFTNLKEKTQSLEDYIVNNEGCSFDTEDQGEVMIEIRKKMTDIYTLLKEKYKNG